MKPIQMREADFKRDIWGYSFPEATKKEFFEYWSEPNKSGTKMRFELEKTWHLGRRLTRWANNDFGAKSGPIKQTAPTPSKKEILTDFDRLDALLLQYQQHPTDVPFSEFGKWYPLLKAEKLLRQFSPSDIEAIRQAYGNDNEKCRCACVQMTFDSYASTNITFNQIMEYRAKLA